jgi:metal-responsive CopG/Arc/MetJ family transcriptional regulator
MQRTNIYLEERQTAALDRLAADEGVSRAELIRRILDRALRDRDDDRVVDLARLDHAFAGVVEIDLPDRRPTVRDILLEDIQGAPE